MINPIAIIVASLAGLAAIAIVSVTGLKGWRDWVGLQARALGTPDAPQVGNAGARIELADLKERVRKLEAIAAGVDL